MIQRNSLSLFRETCLNKPWSTNEPRARTPHATGTSALWSSFRDRQFEDWPPLDGTMSTAHEIRSYDYVNRPCGLKHQVHA
jgi:hypothetical protein